MSIVLSADLCAFRPDAAKRAQVGLLKTRMPVVRLPRLAEAVGSGGEVDVNIRLSRSAAGVSLVAGQVKATVTQHCQRCLDTVEQTLDVELRLGIAAPGSSAELPEGYELYEAESLTLGELLEDELLLALPMISLHGDRRQCGSLAGRVEKMEGEYESEPSRHPFAVLKNLKSN
jgi:uncharacterized protein